MADESFKRKLAAILSADVKGYSRLMDDDEEATVRTIKAYRVAINDLAQQYRGRIVDSPGDNILAEFNSVVDAVNCAVEIQRELAERNAELPDNRKMEFRIGVNLGDVIEENGLIYGDGVNIAARVESIAEPGGICISGRAYDQVENKLGLNYENLGEHQVKNIARPIRVYKVLSYPGAAAHRVVQAKKTLGWKWKKFIISAVVAVAVVVAIGILQFYVHRPAVEPASLNEMAFPLPEKPSIAILPFDNISGNPDQELFCLGLTEEIISALSSVQELFVIARNSTFTYKGKPVKVQQVSEELGVQFVLEGSVRQFGEKIRITTQLIDALNGHHLWSETYDRKIEDLFAVQEDITGKILTELRVEITGSPHVRFQEPKTKNLKAYLKYLKALNLFLGIFVNHRNVKDIDLARQLAEEAISLDPEYPCAHSVLSAIHREAVVYLGLADSSKWSLETAKQLAEKAIDLNPSLPQPHASLSLIYHYMGQFDKSMTEAEKGVSLNPNEIYANGAMGTILLFTGRSKESIPFLQKAIRLDPYSTLYFSTLGAAYLLAEKHTDTIQICKDAITKEPNNIVAHIYLTAAYSAADRKVEAKAAASHLLRLRPKFSLESMSRRI